MAIFTLEEAARFSGRSPREVRLLIERGDLPGRRRAGRWTVTSYDLERSLSHREPSATDAQPHPPVGADPDDPFARPPADSHRTHEPDARLQEKVRRLESELAEVRGELARADARVIDLERAALEKTPKPERGEVEADAPAEDDLSRARKASSGRKGSAKSKRSSAGEASSESKTASKPDGMRQALSPLFRSEGTRPRNGRSRPKPPSEGKG